MHLREMTVNLLFQLQISEKKLYILTSRSVWACLPNIKKKGEYLVELCCCELMENVTSWRTSSQLEPCSSMTLLMRTFTILLTLSVSPKYEKVFQYTEYKHDVK